MHLQAPRTYRPLGIVAGVMAILLSATAAQAQNPNGNNFAGVDFLGRGILYTANYERYVKRAGVGVGIAAWHIDKTVLVLPVYVSFRPIGHTHSLYLSVGVTVGSEVSTLFRRSANGRDMVGVFGCERLGQARFLNEYWLQHRGNKKGR